MNTLANTRPVSIMLPDEPKVVRPYENVYVTLFAWGRVFKITGAERADGIDYGAFACPGMFVGSMNFSAPDGGRQPWQLSEMFSGFSWPGGGNISHVGQVDFNFLVVNNCDVLRQFQIKLIGLELMDGSV